MCNNHAAGIGKYDQVQAGIKRGVHKKQNPGFPGFLLCLPVFDTDTFLPFIFLPVWRIRRGG